MDPLYSSFLIFSLTLSSNPRVSKIPHVHLSSPSLIASHPSSNSILIFFYKV
ncbi:hypothetical protein HanPI659440_Chr00c02g0707231 [Helianthus annuus]|nr:hypothetical protein HanPI659440_Chr00c02g0707231 [Helianthus annuus]